MPTPKQALCNKRSLMVLAWILFSLFTYYSHAQDPTKGSPAIEGFVLIDAQTNLPVPGFDPIPPNATLNLNQLPPHLNIAVRTTGEAGSVRFDFVDRNRHRIENLAPFSLFGDTNGDFNSGRLREGPHTVSATPFSKNKARGTSGKSQSLTFTVVRKGEALLVKSGGKRRGS